MGLKTTSSHGTTQGDSTTIYTRIKTFVIENATYIQLGVQNFINKAARDADIKDTIKSDAFKGTYEFPLIKAIWITATDYVVGEVRLESGTVYKCNEDHTSAAAFATDAAKWDDVSDVHFTQAELETAHLFTVGYDKLKACLIDEGKTVVTQN